MPRIDLIQLRRAWASDWTASNPVLLDGEPGIELDTGKAKYGNGTTPWNDLPYTAEDGEPGPEGPPGIEIGPTPPPDTDILWADTTATGAGDMPGPPGPPGPAGGNMVAASNAETIAGVATNVAVTPGSLTAKLPYVDVRQFGVVGDGNTDCTAAINAADASIAVGGILWFPPGVYRFNGTLTKSANTVWQGVGNNPATGVTGSQLRYYGEATAVSIVGDASATNKRGRWNGLRLVYAGANQGTTTAVGIAISNTQDFAIENSYIGNFGRNVTVTSSAAVYLERCYLFGAVQDSLFITGSSDCWIIYTQASGKRYGIYAVSSSSLQLVSSRPQSSGESNVRVEDTGFFGMIGGSCDSADIDAGTGAKNGVQLHNVDSARINGVQFYANGVDADIVLSVPTGQIAQSLVIQGNVFNSGGGAKKAIRVAAVDGQLKRVAISGNVVDNDTEPLLSIATPGAGGSVNEVSITGNVALGGYEGLPNVATVSTQGNAGWDVKPWVLKSANDTLLITERRVRGNPASAAITLNLPNATYRYNGVQFTIKKTDSSANTVTIQGNGANIDGAANAVLTTQYQSLTVEWDSNLGRWHKVATAA